MLCQLKINYRPRQYKMLALCWFNAGPTGYDALSSAAKTVRVGWRGGGG